MGPLATDRNAVCGGVLLDHHTGLKLVTQPRKEPPRALRHPRLVAATTHNYEHPSHHCSQERANPSKRNTYSRCPHDVTMPDFCSDKYEPGTGTDRAT